jgi:hypothetical protein
LLKFGGNGKSGGEGGFWCEFVGIKGGNNHRRNDAVDIKECRWRCMNGQVELMNLLDQFFDRDLERVWAMLDRKREDGDHKVSLRILMDLKGGRGNLSGEDITERELDMRAWWGEYKWRKILVLQFNFNVMMHFFRLCHGKLENGDKWLETFDVHDVAKLNNIESLLRNYIKDIERLKDYKDEIPDSRQWLLDYALEYALLIWAEEKSVAVGDMPSSIKRTRPGDLGVLLERLGVSVGVDRVEV